MQRIIEAKPVRFVRGALALNPLERLLEGSVSADVAGR